MFSSFDYVTVDAQRRRVYAAHGGGKALLIVDADSGKVVGQVRIGPMNGVAVNPSNGHVFTGDGNSDSVSEVDPVALNIVRAVDVPGHVDAVAYDPQLERIYATEDDGTHVFVIDAATFKLVKAVPIPGHHPEFITVDPQTHDVYQNIDDLSEIAVIDPKTLSVKRTIPTPEIKANHPLQYDAAYHELIVAGNNGMMSAYTPEGTRLGSLAVPIFDQCSLDPAPHVLVCAGRDGITRFQLKPNAAPTLIDTTPTDPGVHTVGVDSQTHAVYTVWSKRDGSGDFTQKFF